MFDLSGQVAVITGASSGLGVQFAHALAQQGADLVLLARRFDRLEEVAADLTQKYGVRALPIECDVTVLESVQSAVAQTLDTFGKVDILVNNAGTGSSVPSMDMTDEHWNWEIGVDLTGNFRVAREFGRAMRDCGNGGRVINIASMYGFVGNKQLPVAAYHAAKGGVVNLTRALAAEWAPYGITVNCICPGFFETELTKATLDTEEFSNYLGAVVPLGRYGAAGELDSTIIFLAAKESTYITGANILVDGGYTCV